MPIENRYLSASLTSAHYAGELQTGPTRPSPRGLLDLLPERDVNAILEQERERRLPLLFQHFGIDRESPQGWEQLARELANRHVPGFSWSNRTLTFGYSANLGLGDMSGFGFLAAPTSPAKRGRGRPRKVSPSFGLLGLLGTAAGDAPKRPAHRPARYTNEEKRRLVAYVDEQLARRRTEAGRPLTHRQLIADLFSGDIDVNLRLYYRFKRDVESFDKSQENTDALRILQSFGRSG